MGKYDVEYYVFDNMKFSPSGFAFARNYDFWIPMVSKCLADSDSIRLDCWIDDEYAISRVLPYANKIDNENTPYMTIILANITPEIVDEIVKNPFDEEGKIAWFSIFLEKDGELTFASSHYGTEILIRGLSEQEVEFLRTFATADARFSVSDSAKRGLE